MLQRQIRRGFNVKLNAQNEGNHLQQAELSTANQTGTILERVIPQQKAKIVGNRKGVIAPFATVLVILKGDSGEYPRILCTC